MQGSASDSHRLHCLIAMIETKRLRIRHLALSDHKSFDALFGDKEVMEFSNGTLNTTEVSDWLKNQIDGYKQNTGIDILAIENKSTDVVIGYCGLTCLLYTSPSPRDRG